LLGVKNTVKFLLQKILGYKSYLYTFARFKIKTLHLDTKENDFFFFLSLLKDQQGAVLDIGANIGIMTRHMAQKLPNTPIHAFEPMPDNAEVLRRIIKEFSLNNVHLHEIALGESKGSVEMILPHQGGTKMQGLSHVKHPSIQEWNQGDEVSVEMEKLDDLLAKEKIQGIKIDIENFEYFALKGGERVLSDQKPIIYAELWENENRTNCMNFLSDLGYSAFILKENKLVPFNATQHKNQNFIFKAN